MRTGRTIRPALSLNAGGGTPTSGATSAQIAAISANTAALTSLQADNSTDAEREAAVATLQASLSGKVDQSVFDALAADTATDAELEVIRAALQADIDALEAAEAAELATLVPKTDIRTTIRDAATAEDDKPASEKAVAEALANLPAPSSTGSTSFIGNDDTPTAYEPSKYLRTNAAGDAVEFVDIGTSVIADFVEGAPRENTPL